MLFEDDVTGARKAMPVRFADTYAVIVPCTFRFKLSADPLKIIQMHKVGLLLSAYLAVVEIAVVIAHSDVY